MLIFRDPVPTLLFSLRQHVRPCVVFGHIGDIPVSWVGQPGIAVYQGGVNLLHGFGAHDGQVGCVVPDKVLVPREGPGGAHPSRPCAYMDFIPLSGGVWIPYDLHPHPILGSVPRVRSIVESPHEILIVGGG